MVHGHVSPEIILCATVKSRYIGDGHHTFNRNPYNRYINPYYWVDDHPLLYGNNGSLDPGTYEYNWESARYQHLLIIFTASQKYTLGKSFHFFAFYQEFRFSFAAKGAVVPSTFTFLQTKHLVKFSLIPEL